MDRLVWGSLDDLVKRIQQIGKIGSCVEVDLNVKGVVRCAHRYTNTSKPVCVPTCMNSKCIHTHPLTKSFIPPSPHTHAYKHKHVESKQKCHS